VLLESKQEPSPLEVKRKNIWFNPPVQCLRAITLLISAWIWASVMQFPGVAESTQPEAGYGEVST
jgi:hypothetical protein